MKNLNGYSHKIILQKFNELFSFVRVASLSIVFILAVSIFSFTLLSHTFASNVTEEIGIKYSLAEKYTDIIYEVSFTATNNQTTVLDYYTLTIPQTEISADSLQCNGRTQNHDTYKQSNYSNITLSLDGYILKPGDKLNCTFQYRLINENTQIDFPAKYADGFDTKYIEITYPSSWGELVFSSIKPQENIKNANSYKITFLNPQITNIRILLGNSLKYKYTISKELTNTSDITLTNEIPLPVATSRQMVSVDYIDPLPNNSYQDIDGNIFLVYDVQPSSKIQVNISGNVMLVDNSDTNSIDDESSSIVDYWDLQSESEINRISLYLNQNQVEIKKNYGLYKALYRYVIDRLSPTSQESSSVENPLRGGVEGALSRKSSAISEDYVDFLIALYREHGIPSRMSLGYVYSPDKNKNGFFHSWVEYFDQKSDWRAIDPALDDVSEGDFFDSDLSDHIAIIQRSSNAFNPKLPYFTDSEYNFVLDDASSDIKENLTIASEKTSVPNFMPTVTNNLTFTNTGNTIINSIICEELGININQTLLPKDSVQASFTVENNTNNSYLCRYTDINNQSSSSTINIKIDNYTYWWEKLLPTVISIIPLIIISIIIYHFVFNKKHQIKRYSNNKKPKSLSS